MWSARRRDERTGFLVQEFNRLGVTAIEGAGECRGMICCCGCKRDVGGVSEMAFSHKSSQDDRNVTNQTESYRGWDMTLVPGMDGRTLEPHHDCSVEVALEALKGRWTTLVLRELIHGDKSYGALSQSLPKLSDKVLTDVLTHLRKCGVVSRTVFRGFPNRTLYRLTATGWEIRPLLIELYRTGLRMRKSC